MWLTTPESGSPWPSTLENQLTDDTSPDHPAHPYPRSILFYMNTARTLQDCALADNIFRARDAACNKPLCKAGIQTARNRVFMTHILYTKSAYLELSRGSIFQRIACGEDPDLQPC